MEVLNYILDNALILIPALNIIGLIIKQIQMIDNKWIPLILLVFGLAGCFGLMGFTVDAAVQGVLITGVAVYGNQLVKQLGNGQGGKEE